MPAANDLAALIAQKKIAAIPSITNPSEVETGALALAEALIEFFSTRGIAIIAANTINTAGSASAQLGPPTPVNATISFTP